MRRKRVNLPDMNTPVRVSDIEALKNTIPKIMEQRYPKADLFNPKLHYDPRPLAMVWDSFEHDDVPEGILTFKKALRSKSNLGEDLRVLLAMGVKPTQLAKAFKKKLILHYHNELADYSILDISKDDYALMKRMGGRRGELIKILEDLGETADVIKDTLFLKIEELPLLVAPQGKVIKIKGIKDFSDKTGPPGSWFSIVTKEKNRYFQVMVDKRTKNKIIEDLAFIKKQKYPKTKLWVEFTTSPHQSGDLKSWKIIFTNLDKEKSELVNS